MLNQGAGSREQGTGSREQGAGNREQLISLTTYDYSLLTKYK
ncbi:hypothetical protein [Chroococcidiopsis sp.]